MAEAPTIALQALLLGGELKSTLRLPSQPQRCFCPVSEARMREMFKAVDAVLRTHAEVGAYNQTI